MRRALIMLTFVGAPLHGQQGLLTAKVQSEVHAEVTAGRYGAAAVLAGANIPMGYYVRTGVSAGAGVTASRDGVVRALRMDGTVRFLLDPFGEHRWGPYAGGGLTVRQDGDSRPMAGLLVVLGVEAVRRGAWTPAVECAVGQGVHLAVVWRRRRADGR